MWCQKRKPGGGGRQIDCYPHRQAIDRPLEVSLSGRRASFHAENGTETFRILDLFSKTESLDRIFFLETETKSEIFLGNGIENDKGSFRPNSESIGNFLEIFLEFPEIL